MHQSPFIDPWLKVITGGGGVYSHSIVFILKENIHEWPLHKLLNMKGDYDRNIKGGGDQIDNE